MHAVSIGRDFGDFLDSVYVQSGLGAYTDADAARIVGWIVVATNMLGLVLAIGFSVPRLRTHRTAFWIPVVCGATCLVVTAMLTVGTAFADPAFAAKLAAG